MSNNGSQVYLDGLSSVTGTRGARDPEVGYVRIEGGKHFRYVYNAGNSDVPPGYAMCVLAPSSTGYSATISTAAGTPVLGVVVHSTLTTSTYGYVCFKGLCKVNVGATAATNIVLQIGANGAYATAVTFSGDAIVNTTITSSGNAHIYA